MEYRHNSVVKDMPLNFLGGLLDFMLSGNIFSDIQRYLGKNSNPAQR